VRRVAGHGGAFGIAGDGITGRGRRCAVVGIGESGNRGWWGSENGMELNASPRRTEQV
jgi:hypothetical protein